MIKPIKLMAAILCTATVSGFVSCSNDDDDPVVPGNTIEEVFPEGVFPLRSVTTKSQPTPTVRLRK